MNLYRTCRKLSSLIENQIVKGVRSPSPEIYNFYLKAFPLYCMLSNNSLNFISDVGVTTIVNIENKIENLRL